MAQQDQYPVDVQQDANTPQAGDRGTSVVPQDLQTRRLEIDIGDNKTIGIEITLRGNLTLQSIGPQAAARGGAGGGSAAATPSLGQGTVLSPQARDDQQFLDQMRGWLTTVATLFINIAFQAAMQRPSWIPDNWFEVLMGKDASGASSPTTPAPYPCPTAAATAASTITYGQAIKAALYVVSNTLTFAISLAMVVLLLLMKKSTPTVTVRTVAVMIASLCITVGLTFAVGNSYGPSVSLWVILILVGYGLGSFLLFLFLPCIMSMVETFELMRSSGAS